MHMPEKSNKSLVKNAAFNVIYRLLNILFPLITAGYVARVLTPAGVGRNFIVQNDVSYFVILALLGIPPYAIRELARTRDDKKKSNKLFTEMLVLNAILTTISIIAFGLCLILFERFKNEMDLYLICGITIVINYFNIDWYFQAVEEYRFIAVRSIIVKILSLVAVFIFVHEPDDVYLYALIYSIANCGHYLINVIRARKTLSVSFRNLELRRHLRPLVLLTLYVISIEIYARIDISMLGIIEGETMVAFYSYAQRVISIIVTFIMAITAVFLPRLSYYYYYDKDKFYKLTKVGVDLMIFLSIPASCGIICLARPLILLWLGSDFNTSVPCLMVLALIIPLKCIGDLACFQVMTASGKEKTLTLSHMLALLVNIALNSVLIPAYGAIGASIASLLSELFVFVLVVLLSRKLLKFRIDIKNLVVVLAASVLMLLSVMTLVKMIEPMWLSFIVGIVAGMTVFVLVNIIVHNSFLFEVMLNRMKGGIDRNERV